MTSYGDSQICTRCDLVLTKFQLLEEQLQKKQKESAVTANVSGPNPFYRTQTRMTYSNAARSNSVLTTQSTSVPEKKVKIEKTRMPSLEIGAQLRYLNIHSNTVENCTLIAFQGEKLKVSIGKGRTQKYINIDYDHIVPGV